MKIVSRFCLFLAMATMTTIATAVDPFVVKDIRLEGVQRTDPGAVFSNINVRVGDQFSDSQATDLVRELFKTGFFKDVRVGVEGDTLVITVQERPAVFKVSVIGSKVITEEQALDALSNMGLQQSTILDDSILELAERELKNLYISQGKYGVEIVSTITPLERNRVAINFDVFEGRKARIKSISFVGNQAFSERELLSEMSLYSGGVFGLFPSSEEYSRQKLEADLEEIRSMYLDQGYVDFNITSTQVQLSKDKEDVFLNINVSEGERFRFGAIDIAGDRVVDHGELIQFVDISAGDLFSRKRLTDLIEKIEERLGQDGYAYASVNAVPQRNAEDRAVSFSLYINAGRRIYVNRIDIVGNVNTRDEVIRRELRQLEGTWYSVSDINRSKQRLDLLGFFSEVKIDTKPIDGRDDQVDLVVSVVERNTGSLSLGIGYSSVDGVLLQVGLDQKNFLGTGNALGLSVSSGKVNETYAVSYTNPYITDDGVSRKISVSKRDTDVTSLVVSSFQSSTYATDIQFGVPLTEYDKIFYGVGAEETDLKIFSNSPSSYRDFVNKNGSKNLVIPITVGWARDKRDSSFFPTEGAVQRLNAELSTPAGDLTYYSASYKAEWYKPISKNTTLHLEGAVGYSDDYDNHELPFYKNFYAGGGRSVRGYQTSSLGPKNEFGESIGGKRRILATTEWLFPFPGLEKDRSMRLALFLDGGGVENSFDDVLSEMRYSTGAGFLWFSPLGPMRFSFAKTLNDEVTDRTEKFQFTLGTTF